MDKVQVNEKVELAKPEAEGQEMKEEEKASAAVAKE